MSGQNSVIPYTEEQNSVTKEDGKKGINPYTNNPYDFAKEQEDDKPYREKIKKCIERMKNEKREGLLANKMLSQCGFVNGRVDPLRMEKVNGLLCNNNYVAYCKDVPNLNTEKIDTLKIRKQAWINHKNKRKPVPETVFGQIKTKAVDFTRKMTEPWNAHRNQDAIFHELYNHLEDYLHLIPENNDDETPKDLKREYYAQNPEMNGAEKTLEALLYYYNPNDGGKRRTRKGKKSKKCGTKKAKKSAKRKSRKSRR